MTGHGRAREVAVHQVDAFTTRPFGGNAAGVVLDADGLSETEMRLIAREMNLSETAYLLRPTRPDADLRIRWFTPSIEVDLCGHATVATFHAALEAGRLALGPYRMECRAGVLPIVLARGPEGGPLVRMGLPVPDLRESSIAGCRLAGPLGLQSDDLSDRLPVMTTGEWCLVPVSGLEALRRARPDAGALRTLAQETGLGSLIALTSQTLEHGSAVHLRMFAPAFGIDEDPVTGSAQGPVAAYLVGCRVIGPLPGEGDAARLRYVAEQGDLIGRPGRIEVEVELAGGRIASIAIEGRAVTVMRGALTLPARA